MSLKLVGAGSMEARMRCGSRDVTLYPSYSIDALGGLLEATITLIESNGVMDVLPEKGPEFEAPIKDFCYWDCDPGSFIWELSYLSAVELRVSLSEQRLGRKKTSRKLLLETDIPAVTWCEMLLSNATRILRRHGLAGYRAAWIRHEFPVGFYLRLLSYRKSKFRLGQVSEDFDPPERTSLSRELRTLLQEVQ